MRGGSSRSPINSALDIALGPLVPSAFSIRALSAISAQSLALEKNFPALPGKCLHETPAVADRIFPVALLRWVPRHDIRQNEWADLRPFGCLNAESGAVLSSDPNGPESAQSPPLVPPFSRHGRVGSFLSIAVGVFRDYISRLMRIALLDLRRGLTEHELVGSPEDLLLPAEWFQHPVAVRLGVQPMAGGWLLNLSLRTSVVRTCDRCLTEMVLDVAEEERCLVLPEAERPSEDEEDRVLLYSPDQEWLDLDQPVRDALRLTQSDYFVCGPECLGLCPSCGQDLNAANCACRPVAPDSPFKDLDSLRTAD